MPWNMLPRFVTGIKWVDDAIDEIASAIERGNRWRVQAPLVMVASETGMTLSLRETRRMTVKLTSANSDHSYNATQVRATASGAWTTASGAWTGKVWELNGTTTLTAGTYVRAEYYPETNDWRFQAGQC